MPAPALDSVAQRTYEKLTPLAYAEAENSYSLAYYLAGLGILFQEVDDYASDGDNGEVGWSSIVDINRAPSKGLEWLSQMAGVFLPPRAVGQSDASYDAQCRAFIVQASGQARGRPASLIAAAQLHLTGTKDVLMQERYTGDPYQLWIATRTAQTPSTTQTLADIMSQKPAGIVLTYTTLAGQTFNELLSKGTFQTVFTTYATFQAAYTGP